MGILTDVNGLYENLELLKNINAKLFGFAEWSSITLLSMSREGKGWLRKDKGIYFFYDLNEKRADKESHRVVRVGTHGIKQGEGKSTVWKRLRGHKGTTSGGGNHRGSVFRKLVGEALIERDRLSEFNYWSSKKDISMRIRQLELPLEKKVSEYIGQLPFIVLSVNPKSEGDIQRKYLEANIIALLSNVSRSSAVLPCADTPSNNWLGRYSSEHVRLSGLWQSEHTQEAYNDKFLPELSDFVERMAKEM